MAQKVGKIITERDFNVLITRTAKLFKPNGQVLAVYLQGGIPEELRERSRETLYGIKEMTDNRGLASGSVRVQPDRTSSRAAPVLSATVGAFERQGGRIPYCRLTAWTGRNFEKYTSLFPFVQHVAGLFERHVPDRYRVQLAETTKTKPEWVIPQTPYTTITVNHTYATGVHKDAGDLEAGFSNMAVLRSGQYRGGYLTFPEYRVAVDMKDGDVILFDAHEWHGNTEMTDRSEDAVRVSTVLYFRERMVTCGTAEEELERVKGKKGSLDEL